MLRYTMVSVVTTVISFTVLGIVFGAFHIWSEIPSAVFSNLVALAPSYYLNRGWVWGKTGRSHWRREVIPFWIVSITGVMLSIFAAAVARHITVAYDLSHAVATGVLLSIVFAAFGLLWVLKYAIFNHLFKIS